MKYSPLTLLHVSLDFGDAPVKVGRLALKDRHIYFEYDDVFLGSGLQISPFKLPLQAGATLCKDATFDGLFGVFNDCLPDGWGRLLLDRQMRHHGIVPALLSPLDRLAHVGKSGMGALIYEPDASHWAASEKKLNLDLLAREAAQVLTGESDAVFEHLLALSGSSAGARPKIMIGVSADKKRLVHGTRPLPKTFSHWMIKFPSSYDSKDIGSVEYAYSLMAQASGLEMMPTHLFAQKKGGGYFGVKRFDREGEKRLHMHTIAGLLHADHRFPSLDYEDILRATLAVTRNVKHIQSLFRLATFNVMAHNRDDHAKNFSLIMDASGSWHNSPAYDLTFSYGPGGEHSTTVMGEGKVPGIPHLKMLAEKFGVSQGQAERIIAEVRSSVVDWPRFAAKAGVSKASQRLIWQRLKKGLL